MRDPALQALTKAGYFSADKGQPTDPRLDTLYNIAEAVQTNVPFAGLEITLQKIVRHSDTNSAEFTVHVNMKDADWKPEANGSSGVDIGFAGASLSSRHYVLASKTEAFTMSNASQDPNHLEKLQATLYDDASHPAQHQIGAIRRRLACRRPHRLSRCRPQDDRHRSRPSHAGTEADSAACKTSAAPIGEPLLQPRQTLKTQCDGQTPKRRFHRFFRCALSLIHSERIAAVGSSRSFPTSTDSR